MKVLVSEDSHILKNWWVILVS